MPTGRVSELWGHFLPFKHRRCSAQHKHRMWCLARFISNRQATDTMARHCMFVYVWNTGERTQLTFVSKKSVFSLCLGLLVTTAVNTNNGFICWFQTFSSYFCMLSFYIFGISQVILFHVSFISRCFFNVFGIHTVIWDQYIINQKIYAIEIH